MRMSEPNLESVTREVWEIYSGLTTTHRIFNALMSKAGYVPQRIIGFGRQGSGKTTFLYYALKVAYTMYRCHLDGVRKDGCLGHAIKTYGLCLGRDCPKDQVDEMLLPGFYLTVDDLLNRFIKDVATGEIGRRRVVFFDDAFTPKSWWLKGGRWRELYNASKDFDQFYRDSINVLILTAPTLNYFTADYVRNSLLLEFNAYPKDGSAEVVAVHYIYPHFVKFFYGETYLFKAKKIGFIDTVPFRRAYGLPKWLEEMNTERRQFVLRESFARVLRKMQEEKEVTGP